MVEVWLQELDNSPRQKESYKAIAAINHQFEETDKVTIKDVRLNNQAVSSPLMIHDIALIIAGCQGFIPILRQGRDNPAFICLLKWTMENVYTTNLDMMASIVKSNLKQRGDLTPRTLPFPVAASSSPTKSIIRRGQRGRGFSPTCHGGRGGTKGRGATDRGRGQS